MFKAPVPHFRTFAATDPSDRGFRATVMVRYLGISESKDVPDVHGLFLFHLGSHV